MIFISPPFGNYIKMDNFISVSGSYTLHPRDGLFTQILKTLRYSFKYDGWINKIGLRNKGIDWAIKNVSEDNIISIGILNKEDIPLFLDKIPEHRNIEINVSCPNVEKEMISSNLSGFVNDKRRWCIIKISPKCSEKEIDNYYNMGFRQFHCCNTIPIERGGLSGSSLIPYTTSKIKYINEKYSDTEIIAGGGIKYYNDIIHYKSIGAKHFSISTLLFHPKLFATFCFNNYYYRKS
tara:strand:+ start:5586 stop:6293 length:708 start_codon:yes stop_codon:yes gene_type:complete